jgi:hypothetical protein
MKLDPSKFYFKDSLYNTTEITEDDFQELFNLIYFSGKIDSYCPFCQKETVFEGVPIREKRVNAEYLSTHNDIYSFDDYKNDYNYAHLASREYRIQFKCLREDYLHFIQFYVKVEKDKIFKIGQNPSVADLTENFLSKKYRGVLSNDSLQEFNKAIGLYAHSVGIGSFVYLRRIFETLILEAHDKAMTEIDKWDDESYNTKRMDEKIQVLKKYLPEFLVRNKSIYGILSRGIHELKEKDCLDIFPIVQAGIELILDEKVKVLDQERKIKETSILINDINKNLK